MKGTKSPQVRSEEAERAARLNELRTRQTPRPQAPRPQAPAGPPVKITQGTDVPGAAVVTAAPPEPRPQAAAATSAEKERAHVRHAVIMPDQRKLKPENVPDGKVAYVVTCKGCPWHRANPVAHRVLLADAPIPGFEVGTVKTLFHAKRNGWWGDWEIVAIAARAGEAVSIEGSLPDWGKENLGLWHAKPAPAQPAKGEAAAEPAAEPAESPQGESAAAEATQETAPEGEGEGADAPVTEPEGTEGEPAGEPEDEPVTVAS